MKQVIRLHGISREIQGKVWEADSILRVGRLGSLEIVLDDGSVSRIHAELKLSPQGWMVRDLESTNGTFVNGVRLGAEERPLRFRDVVQFGKVAVMVELNESSALPTPAEEQGPLDSITTLANSIELRDSYTGGHSARVTNYALLLAQQLGLPHRELELLRMGAPLHDIGKIGIPDSILCKPDRLTPEEYKIMQTHTIKGDAIISTFPDLHNIRPIVRSHHERWDGAGYPDRLAGAQIPLVARIVAVANAFDAITSNAPYHPEKKGRRPEMAFAEVRKHAGHQFDPVCATAFLDIQEKIVESMAELRQLALLRAMNPG